MTPFPHLLFKFFISSRTSEPHNRYYVSYLIWIDVFSLRLRHGGQHALGCDRCFYSILLPPIRWKLLNFQKFQYLVFYWKNSYSLFRFLCFLKIFVFNICNLGLHHIFGRSSVSSTGIVPGSSCQRCHATNN